MDAFTGTDLACIRGERLVFSDLAFEVASGEALVLRGPNGSGKSSLLRVMAGLSRAAFGTLAWNTQSVREDPEAHRARVHYVGHLDAIKPVLTVLEQATSWAQLRGASAGSAALRAGGALEALGVSHLADVPGQYLSAGQRRRVALARVLTAPAPIWLLDEPHTALDEEAVGRLNRAVRSHRSDGGIVVISTHGAEEPDNARTLELSAFASEADEPVRC